MKMKKRLRKIGSAAVCLAMAMSLAACGNNTDNAGSTDGASSTDSTQKEANTDTEAKSSDPTNMTIILRGGTYADVIKAALPEFEQEHNCKIDVLDMAFDDLHSGIALDAANEKGSYDLCMVDGSWMSEFTENNVLANLSDMGYSFDDDIISNTTSICKVGDDIYLAPYFGNVTVMLYNKADVEAAGYKPEDIKTLDDMLEVAKAAQKNGDIEVIPEIISCLISCQSCLQKEAGS